ncbi:MAG: hypothetical protein ACREBG_30785 [Pyrinomonadaceae bacterium]
MSTRDPVSDYVAYWREHCPVCKKPGVTLGHVYDCQEETRKAGAELDMVLNEDDNVQ